MTKKFIAGGCSFTFGHELSDDNEGKQVKEGINIQSSENNPEITVH